MSAETNSNEIIGYMALDENIALQCLEVGQSYTVSDVFQNKESGYTDFLALTVGQAMNFTEYDVCRGSLFEKNYSYFQVSAFKNDIIEDYGDEKIVSKIKILAKVTRDEIVDRQIEIARNSPCFDKYIEDETIATNIENAKLLVSGPRSTAATSGYGATVIIDDYTSTGPNGDVTYAASGECSSVVSLARLSSLAIGGKLSVIECRGSDSSVAISGPASEITIKSDETDVAVSGDCSTLKSTAQKATIAIAGSYSTSSIEGEDNVIAIVGKGGCFKGINGTPVCVADYDKNGKFRCFVTGRIGEKGLKPDTIYTVKNGRFVEASVRGSRTIMQKSAEKQLVKPVIEQMELILPEPLEAAS